MWFIPMNKKTFLSLITGLLLCFVAGCKESAPPEKPVVVKKRIDQTSTTTPEPEAEKPETAATPSPQNAKKAAETPAPKAPETTAQATDAATAEKTSPEIAETRTPAAETPKSTVKKTAVPVPESAPAAEPPVGATDDDTGKDKAPAAQAENASTAGLQDEQPDTVESEEVSLKNSFMEDNTTPRYDPTGKIDPFAALFSDKQDELSSGESEPKRPLTPLEKIDISQLKLVAVLQAKSGDRAMVEDATGKPYILSPGTFIGINSGTVTKILKDRVVIEETSKDILGRETSNTRELKLQKPLGEE